MSIRTLKQRLVVSLLCSSLVWPTLVFAKTDTQITLNIGQPNVWSLSQAHYLLALLRNNHRSLAITAPGLNPNAIDGARIDILRTLLGIDAQFSTPQGLKNSVAQQQFAADFARKQAAIARVDELSRERIDLVREISQLNSDLAKLGPAPTGNQTGDPDTERRRAELVKTIEAREKLNAALQAEITTLSTQANAPVTLSNLDTGAPFGSAVTFPTLPNDFADISALMGKLLGSTATPSVNASQALDNYINMQYEKLAKELTLLRDEVGPDERLIFLELPSSLYSVPKKDDDFMVQVEWGVANYVGKCPEKVEVSEATKVLDAALARLAELDPNSSMVARLRLDQRDSIQVEEAGPGTSTTIDQKPPLTDDAIDKFLRLATNEKLDWIEKLELSDKYSTVLSLIEGLDKKYQPLIDSNKDIDISQTKKDSRERRERQELLRRTAVAHQFNERLKKAQGIDELRANINAGLALTQAQRASIAELQRFIRLYPALRDVGSVDVKDDKVVRASPAPKLCTTAAEASKFRVVDIIPRQSALNVNDVHATQKGWALAAQFLSLFGFGGKVSYQRQRTHYEQFISQDVFASGFGKGLSRFGWTIGPVPGTRRLAPGPRTTFAVMAIPKEALRVTLQATGKAFKRDDNPNALDKFKLLTGQNGQSFEILIPNESTEGFWVDSINYTPVPKGQRVTAVIGGRYFSPLTGVMVDGLPLKRAIAIAKHESETTTLPNEQNAPGEYEYINSTQIVASFTRATAGTPLITLISPEKTATINYFNDLRINFHVIDSLLHHSQSEPMFIDAFSLNRLEVSGDPTGNVPVKVTLVGTGFRSRAEIGVNDIPVTNPQLLSTATYAWQIDNPSLLDDVWIVTYRHGQEHSSITFDTNTDGRRAEAPTIDSIENPSTGKAEGLTSGGYTVIIRGKNLRNVSKVFFGTTAVDPHSQKHPNVLFVTVPKNDEGGVRVLLTILDGNGNEVSTNVLDFITPGQAIFKYVKPAGKASEKPDKQKPPQTKEKRRAGRKEQQ